MKDRPKPPGIPREDCRLIRAGTQEEINQVRLLFREYADGTSACECFEGLANELAGLPGPYAPPTGRLLFAQLDAQSAGCVALRKLEDGICEMKRLYVRPAFRGHGLGRQLAESIIHEAGQIGYRAMRLDTLSSMVAAQALYHSLGFRAIPRYNNNPGTDVIHLELKL